MKKILQIIFSIMLGIFMSSMIVSCGDDDNGGKKEVTDADNYNSNKALENENSDVMRLEVPKITSGANILPKTNSNSSSYFCSHWAKSKNNSSTRVMNYCYEYDASCYHTRWVAFSFDDITKQSNTSRSNEWGEDLSLPSNVRLPYTSYTGSGYQRGHLCASQDRVFSTEANVQTFYMSNMSPQQGPFNECYWAALEALIRNWAKSDKFKTLYVCKGGTIKEGQRLGSFTTKNSKDMVATVVVPKYYFMAILAETPNKTYQSIGFFLEHKYYGYEKGNYPPASIMKQHALSIDVLEEKTGIDFFCNLPDKLENNVERGYNVDAWAWI